ERAQEALRQAQKMEAVGTLAGGVAHHFNNILCGIMGYTELVLGRLTRDELSRVYLRKALKSSLRARDLVAQLLDFSRQDESVRKPIDASLPVYETLNHLKTAAPDNVEIKMRINDDECMVRANPDRLRQVGINLCTNALQALEGNDGVVEVSLEPVQLEDDAATELGTDPGPYVLFSVADSGIGIPAA
ncbi:MAG: hypothetical protein GY731_09120, partial [Gammaproteobacteria bacterium]|nr:hypothetical protein [Gammaproteobacteria bacterium]